MGLASSTWAEHRRMTPVEAADAGSNPAPAFKSPSRRKNMTSVHPAITAEKEAEVAVAEFLRCMEKRKEKKNSR